MAQTQEYEFDKWRFFKSLQYTPHAGQTIFHNSSARFKLLACGRRWGKTLSAGHEALFALLQPESVGWVVAPTYDLSEKIFRVAYWSLQKYAPQLIESARYTTQAMEIRTKLGSVLKAKTADNPDSLIGEGLNFCIIDEAARIKDQIWDGALRPSLADKKGTLIAISTPKGKNWFHTLYTRGQDPQFSDYKSFQFPSRTNPYLDPVEIENAKSTTPDRLFRQEWLAEFLDDAGGVFRDVQGAIGGSLEHSSFDECVTGIDLAKYEDFTVIIVVNKKTKQVIHFERFNQIEWATQIKRIRAIVDRYPNNTLMIDSTGVGDSVYETMQKEFYNYRNVRVEGVKITMGNKKELIDNLALAIERREIQYPVIPELLGELSIYTYQLTPQRNVIYGAPPGYHDDCVISLALAYKAIFDQPVGGFGIYGVRS